eukprot:10438338-Prorocentrum_lima.AAC.1
MKFTIWEGHAHLSIQRILSADAMCVGSHNMLQMIDQDQGFIPQVQHLQAQPRTSVSNTQGRGIQDKIQDCNPRFH